MRYPVGHGWWPLLDARLPEIRALVPEVDVHVKEKYGCCRVQFYSTAPDRAKMAEAHRIAHEIEAASAHICEVCGGAGEVIDVGGWLTCLCERCAALSPEERCRAEEEKTFIVRSVAGSMALSGMDLTEEDRARIRLLADDPGRVGEIVKQLVEKHKA